ncbi:MULTISPECIES: hypothetical protein [Streptomyces]|uniref:hypothetical protein n=1 Tax=Streptomyces TaxID=1883 RepID=UPI0013148FD7|nr:hypothetical protein [Streptomyces sp. MOE7]
MIPVTGATGAASAVTDTVPRLLGRPARSLATFLTDHTALLPSGPDTAQENR